MTLEEMPQEMGKKTCSLQVEITTDIRRKLQALIVDSQSKNPCYKVTLTGMISNLIASECHARGLFAPMLDQSEQPAPKSPPVPTLQAMKASMAAFGPDFDISKCPADQQALWNSLSEQNRQIFRSMYRFT